MAAVAASVLGLLSDLSWRQRPRQQSRLAVRALVTCHGSYSNPSPRADVTVGLDANSFRIGADQHGGPDSGRPDHEPAIL